MTAVLRRPATAITAMVLATGLAAGLAGCSSSAPAARPGPGQGRSTAARPSRPASRPASRSASPAASGPSAADQARSAFSLLPAAGPGYLAPGSDPGALPGDVLIADMAPPDSLLMTHAATMGHP